MKFKFIPLLLVAIAPSLMSATNKQLVQPFVQTSAVTSSIMITVDELFYIDTGGEWVHFTGQLHLVAIFFPTDPVFPNDPIRIQTNALGIKGIGESSGLTYTVTGATSFTANFSAGSTNNTFISSYRLLPPNPVQPLSGSLRFAYDISFDSFGKLTDATANITIVEGP